MTKTKPKKYRRNTKRKGGVLDDKFKEIFKNVDDYVHSTANEDKITQDMIHQIIDLYGKEIIDLQDVIPLQLQDFIGTDNNLTNRREIVKILSNIKKIVEEKYDKKSSVEEGLIEALKAQQLQKQEPQIPIKKDTNPLLARAKAAVAKAAKSVVSRFSFRRDTNSLGANIEQIKIKIKDINITNKPKFIEKLREQLKAYATILLQCNLTTQIDTIIDAIEIIKKAIKTLNTTTSNDVTLSYLKSNEIEELNSRFNIAFTYITSVIADIKKESKTKPKTTDEIDAITVQIQEAIIELIILDENDENADIDTGVLSDLFDQLIAIVSKFDSPDNTKIIENLNSFKTEIISIKSYNYLNSRIKIIAYFILEIKNIVSSLAPSQEEEEEPPQETKKTLLGRLGRLTGKIFKPKPKSELKSELKPEDDIYVLLEQIKLIINDAINKKSITHYLYVNLLLVLYKKLLEKMQNFDVVNFDKITELTTSYNNLNEIITQNFNHDKLDSKTIKILETAMQTADKIVTKLIHPKPDIEYIKSLLQYRHIKSVIESQKSSEIKYNLNSNDLDNTDIIANIEANSSLLFSRLKTFILLDIKNYITYLHNNYDSEPKCKTDLNKLMFIFIPFIYMFINDSGFIHTDDDDKIYDYKKVNYKLFKDLFTQFSQIPETLNDLFKTYVTRNSLINDIISIIELLLLSNYLNLNYLYSQICINIYLYETKNSGNILSNKHIPKKIDSILHFIMRLFTNTLCYYLYNIFMYTFYKPTSELNNILEILNYNISTRDIEKFKNFSEESIYKIHTANINKYELLLILTRLYYENSKKCTYTRRMYGGYGVEAIKLVDMSYEKPSYLLNHTIMDLCHLLKFYKFVKKEVFNEDKKKSYSDLILSPDIKNIYIDIIQKNQ